MIALIGLHHIHAIRTVISEIYLLRPTGTDDGIGAPWHGTRCQHFFARDVRPVPLSDHMVCSQSDLAEYEALPIGGHVEEGFHVRAENAEVAPAGVQFFAVSQTNCGELRICRCRLNNQGQPVKNLIEFAAVVRFEVLYQKNLHTRLH